MNLLGLLRGGDLAGANSPDGLIGNDNLGPFGGLGLEGLELLADDLNGFAGLALLERLAAAPNDADAVFGGVLGLGGDELVGLLENGAALRVAEDGPVNLAVEELRDGELSGEGAVGLVVDVLGGNANLGAEGVADEDQVDGAGRDNDLYGLWLGMVGDEGCGQDDKKQQGKRTNRRVELGVVQVVDDILDGRHGAVPVSQQTLAVNQAKLPLRSLMVGPVHLEVAADEEFASHFCD